MVSNNAPPDERVVYLAFKNVFKGPKAEFRKDKAIRKLVQRSREKEEVMDLVREHNIDVVCNSVRTLLCNEIFASTLKAKIRFPELFDLSPTQSAEREASEAEAARHEADAIEHAVQGRWDDGKLPDTSVLQNGNEAGEQLLLPTEYQEPKASRALEETQPPPPLNVPIPPLFPIYLPFEAQHRVLTHLQNLLELACYEYGKRTMPATLRRRDWDCPEAVELNRWMDEFKKNQDKFPVNEGTRKPLSQLFSCIANIRHTAVHRIRVSAKSIEQFLLDAEALTTLLENTSSAKKIKKLRQNTMATIEELQRNKQFLRSRLDDTLSSIAAQRKELKQMEDMAIAKMEEEDCEYQELASISVREAIAPSEASFSTAVETERDDTNRLEATDEIGENDGDDDVDEDWDVKVTP